MVWLSCRACGSGWRLFIIPTININIKHCRQKSRLLACRISQNRCESHIRRVWWNLSISHRVRKRERESARARTPKWIQVIHNLILNGVYVSYPDTLSVGRVCPLSTLVVMMFTCKKKCEQTDPPTTNQNKQTDRPTDQPTADKEFDVPQIVDGVDCWCRCWS